MPDIPSYNDWMKHTALGFMSPRSIQLQAVDTALRDYWNTPAGAGRQPKRRALGDALANWIGTKMPEWRTSQRNKPPERIVERLYDALNTTLFTDLDLDAFTFQDEVRRKQVQNLFLGKEIAWKVLNPAKDAKEVYAELKRGRTPSKDAADIKKGLAKQTARRATYEPGKWTLARDVSSPVIEAGLGIDAIRKGMLNKGTLDSVAAQRFGLDGAAQAHHDFHEMLHDLWGGMATPSEISWHLMGTLGVDAKTLAADVTPIVSNVISGVKVLIAWGKVGMAAYRRYKVNCQTGFIMPAGDIMEGFKALQVVLDRVVTSETTQAGLQTADLATRTVLSFADLGAASSTAVGVAFTLAKLLHKLYLLGREFAETRDARKLLANPDNLDSRLFAVYPLLGCYMLLCSDTDAIINMVRAGKMRKGAIRFGDLAWKEQVVWVKKYSLDPVLERAAAMVYSSPFFLRDAVTKRGMPVHALYGVGGFDRLGQKFSKAGTYLDIMGAGLRAA
jgi:hypothetical protein